MPRGRRREGGGRGRRMGCGMAPDSSPGRPAAHLLSTTRGDRRGARASGCAPPTPLFRFHRGAAAYARGQSPVSSSGGSRPGRRGGGRGSGPSRGRKRGPEAQQAGRRKAGGSPDGRRARRRPTGRRQAARGRGGGAGGGGGGGGAAPGRRLPGAERRRGAKLPPAGDPAVGPGQGRARATLRAVGLGASARRG